MAISVNDSTVARWASTLAQSAGMTSGTFTPANNSLLVLCLNWDEQDTSNQVVWTVSGGSLTWTTQVERNGNDSGATAGGAAIITAPVSTGASMSITVTRNTGGGTTARQFSAKAYIVTGQAASPIGTNGEGSSTTNNISPTLFTATGAGRAFYCGTDWNALGTPASTDTEDAAHYSGAISVLSAYKASDHTSGSVTGNLDASGTSAADWNWVALEILAAADSGVTQALTGSAATASAGTLIPSNSGALSGQAATASAGTLAPAHSQALTGSAVTASAGTLVGSKTVALAGQAAAAAAGTVAPSHSQALTGQEVTASAGTITYTAGVAVALTGQAVAAEAGTLGAEHAQALTGQAATAAAGTIGYSGSTVVNVALSGQAVTAQAGTLAPSHSQALTGQAATTAAGTISYTSATVLNLALTGQAVTSAAGTLVPSHSQALAGQTAAAEAGTLAPAHSQALTGSAVTAAAGSLAYVPGITIALTGQAVTATAGSLGPAVDLLLAGSDIVVSAGTLTISGTEPVLRYAPDAHTIVGAARLRAIEAAERARLLAGRARVRTHLGTN